MAVPNLTEVLDNFYTSTWQHMKSEFADNFFDATPFWFWLKDGNRIESIRGGRFVTEPLQFDKSDGVQWVGRGGTVKLNDFQFLSLAKFDWRYLVGTIVRYGVDDQQNAGKMEIINLANAKMENVKNSLISEGETRLFGSTGGIVAGTTTEDAAAFDGLQHLVADDPTASSVVGGFNSSTDTWWRNKSRNMTGKSFATFGLSNMRTLLNDTSNNLRSDAPDIIVSGQTPYEFYEDTVLPVYRVTNRKLADMGFENIQFKGRPMIWSPSAANTRMYMLNTRFIKYFYDPALFFDMTEWKPIPSQVNDRVAHIVTACGFKVSRRRCQGVLHSIDTQ